MIKLLKIGAIAAVVVAVIVWPVAWYMDSTAQTVHFISPLDEAAVEVNKFTFEEDAEENPTDEDIIAIYGSKSGSDPERIVFPDDSKIIRPDERKSLTLYAIEGDSRPLQSQFVFYMTRVVSIGAAVAAFGLILLLSLLKRRRAQPAAA